MRRFLAEQLRDEPAPAPTSKEDAECCRLMALDDGRPVIGWCSPSCLRREEYLAGLDRR